MLHTTTNGGLHEFVAEQVLRRYARPRVRAADYQLTREPLAWTLRLASIAFPGEALLGDNHVLVLEAP
jgi:hypothetical protein